jgi:hypothetical protein
MCLRLFRPLLLCTLLIAGTASIASAAHVAGVLPLSSSPNHSHEKFTPMLFPSGDYSNYDFSFADLSNCAFAGPTNLTGASFHGANLTNVNFSACTLNMADFRGANLTFANLPCVGGADFRGAILTSAVGGGEGCFNCLTYGSSLIDFNCTVLPSTTMCLLPAPFRGIVAGVVFSDLNLNGTLDLGEPGVPGASVNIRVRSGHPRTHAAPTSQSRQSGCRNRERHAAVWVGRIPVPRSRTTISALADPLSRSTSRRPHRSCPHCVPRSVG